MNKKALSLIEVIISLAIFTVSILCLVPPFSNGILYAKKAKFLTEGTHNLKSRMEEILSYSLTESKIEELLESDKEKISFEIKDLKDNPSLKIIIINIKGDNFKEGEIFLICLKKVEKYKVFFPK